MDIQTRMTSVAMIGATWVMWVLVALSIVALAICLDRALVFIRTSGRGARIRDQLREALARDDLAGARANVQHSRAVEAQILVAGLEAARAGAAASEERMRAASQLVRLQLERRLSFLGTVGANAPFVGLLGTVIGIIRAFHELDEAGGKVSAGLMTDVGEALVATAIGILVAIPAVAAFNYFQRTLKVRLASADAVGHELLAYLKRA